MLKKMSRAKVVYIVVGFIIAAFAGVIITSTYVATHAEPYNPMPDYKSKSWTDEAGNPIPLGSEQNPYTILEIVPDTDSAMVGYLIDGQEPRSLKSIGAQYNSNSDSTEIDPNSATGIYKEAFASETSPGSVVSDPDEETGLPVLTIFDKDKEAIQVNPAPTYTEKKDNYSGEAASDNVAYSQYGYFYKVSDNTGYYKYENGAFVSADGTSGNYNWECLGHFKYVGYGKGTCTRNTDGRGFSYNSDSSAGTIGSDAIKYEYSVVGDFVWEAGLAYSGEDIYAENSTVATYVDGNDTKTRSIEDAQLGDKIYMTRTEDKFYEYLAYDITCKDPLLKNLVGEDVTGTNYAIQVVTVTPDQLVVDNSGSEEDKKATGIINMADLIIVHDCATGYRIAKSLDGESVYTAPAFGEGERKDLTAKTVAAIIERGASGYTTNEKGGITSKPAAIVFDEVAIEAAEINSCPNLKTLYDVYNNLGAKLAYNWKQNTSYVAKVSEAVPDENKRFGYSQPDALGKSNFVYNFVGDDGSSLTTGFICREKIERTTFNDSAFFNLDTYDETRPDRPSTMDGTMSVATMLLAIDRETYGIHQSKKLNILELQPNENYYYNESNRDDWVNFYVSLFPWFVGSSKDIADDINVETMATYQFIGRNEDLNENYDMVLIGSKKQDETNGKNTGNEGYNYDFYGSQLAYTAVGDEVTKETSSDAYESNLRYSGNDLTKKKYDQLMEFANYAPVILGDELYDNAMGARSEPNTYVVDESSFIYQIAKENSNSEKPFINKHSEGVENNQKAVLVKNSMTVEDVSVEFINTAQGQAGLPTEYENYNDSNMNYNLQQDGAGNNVLQYHFVLDGSDESTYGINIYTDSNGDGIFEGCISHMNEIEANIDKETEEAKYEEATSYSEKSSNLIIFDETEKYEVGEGDLHGGVLLNGHTYLVTKILPESDIGLIPWKLEIYNKDNQSIRYSKIGYTRIKSDGSGSSKPSISVLQMCTTYDMKSNGSPYVVFDSNYVFFELLEYQVENTVAKHFDQFANVPGGDFNSIKVDYMENYSQGKQKNTNIKPWYGQFNDDPKGWADFLLENYDMLIIGCRDVAKFTTNESFLYGFEEFRKAGKAIILTHDLVEDYSISSNITNDVRYYLRDISGQLRKYYNATDVADNGSKTFYYDRFWTKGSELSTIYSPLDYDTYIDTGSRVVRGLLHILSHIYTITTRLWYNIL